MTSLIVIEDNLLVQKALRKILTYAENITILAIFNNLADALKAQLPLQPEIVLLDLALPDSRGGASVEKIKVKYAQARIVIYTAYENEKDILSCMLAGANGYITKDTPPERLRSEINVIAQGGSTLTPRIAEKILRKITPARKSILLSDRETQVLNFISLGLRYEDIADELDLSVHTVRRHIEKIYKKLDVTSRGQAVAQGIKDGIIRFP